MVCNAGEYVRAGVHRTARQRGGDPSARTNGTGGAKRAAVVAQHLL
jgi:hypothetical protein